MNFVAGSGGELGQALVNAKPLKAISFTGSCEIGHWLHGEASKRRLRIQLEMGGKNPTIVLADADFNSAVENTVNAAFFSTGQKCTATSRAIVEDTIYDRFVEALVERTKKLKVGDGMQAGIDIGPCVDEAQLKTVLRLHRDRQEGVRRAEDRRQPADRRRLRQGLLRRADDLRRCDRRDDHRAGRDLRPGAGRDARQGFRRRHAHRQQHPVRPLGVDPDHQSLARLRLRLPHGGGPADGQPAQRRAWSISFRSAAPRIPASDRRSRVRRRWNFTAITRRFT